MTIATRTRDSRQSLAIGAAVVTLVLAPACTPSAPLGYWTDDSSAPPAPAGSDAPGPAGGAGAPDVEDAGRDAATSEPDGATELPDAWIGVGDAQAEPPDADANAPGASDGGVCDLGGGVLLPDAVTAAVTTTARFAGGATLPAGRYRVSYVDGCRKFNEFGGWTVHGTAPTLTGATTYTIVSGEGVLTMAPGTVGLFAGPGAPPNGAFATYAECVAANQTVPPVDFDFDGGTLGIADIGDGTPNDDVPGESEGGVSPTFELALLDPCP